MSKEYQLTSGLSLARIAAEEAVKQAEAAHLVATKAHDEFLRINEAYEAQKIIASAAHEKSKYAHTAQSALLSELITTKEKMEFHLDEVTSASANKDRECAKIAFSKLVELEKKCNEIEVSFASAREVFDLAVAETRRELSKLSVLSAEQNKAQIESKAANIALQNATAICKERESDLLVAGEELGNLRISADEPERGVLGNDKSAAGADTEG